MINAFGADRIAIVLDAKRYEGQAGAGWLIYYDLDGYVGQPFFVPDTQDDGRFAYRQDRSGMPYKIGASAFKWDLYGVDVNEQKRIANSFVLNYADWRDADGRGLYIASETMGSGKTLLACCLATEVIRKHDVVVKFISSAEYVAMCAKKEDTSVYRDCELLVFDDIGSESGRQDWVAEIIFRLVNTRYERRLATIYTSNVPLDERAQRDRVYSRIQERSIFLKLPEVSIRKKLSDKSNLDFLNQVLENNK